MTDKERKELSSLLIAAYSSLQMALDYCLAASQALKKLDENKAIKEVVLPIKITANFSWAIGPFLKVLKITMRRVKAVSGFITMN